MDALRERLAADGSVGFAYLFGSVVKGRDRALVRAELIPAPLGERLEGMAGFRNVLVHGYAAIVPEKVPSALGQLEDMREYVRELGSYLEEQGVLPE